MKPLYALIVHGVGIAKPEYSKGLQKGILEVFNKELRKELKSSEDYSQSLVFKEVLWEDVVAKAQSELSDILKKGFGITPQPKKLNFFKKLITIPKRAMNWIRTNFVAEFVGDVLSYRHPDVYRNMHQKVAQQLASIPTSVDDSYVSIIAHSLGSVVSSDFIYDNQKSGGRLKEGMVLSNFFTFGSPIALFALQYGPELFKSPIHLEDKEGSWCNIIDRDDPIAYPLKNLNDAYKKAVTYDLEVNTSFFGLAHVKYWDNKKVYEIIGQKLATDWLQLNSQFPHEKIVSLNKGFEKMEFTG